MWIEAVAEQALSTSSKAKNTSHRPRHTEGENKYKRKINKKIELTFGRFSDVIKCKQKKIREHPRLSVPGLASVQMKKTKYKNKTK